jgi:hypothetical protein
MAEHGITDVEARGHFAAWAAADRYFPLDEELAATRRAGFARGRALLATRLVRDLVRPEKPAKNDRDRCTQLGGSRAGAIVSPA